MTKPTDITQATRRKFLAGAAGFVAASATPAHADNAKNLPPNVADWTRNLGDGVGVRPYGHPSQYEKDVHAAA
jgi:sulfane dehydrogenase subunit SoxC